MNTEPNERGLVEQDLLVEQHLLEMSLGFAAPLIVETALKLGVFEAVSSGPMGLEELARRTEASARGIRVIADALVGLRLLDREAEGYKLREGYGTLFVRSHPHFRGGLFEHLSDEVIPLWLQLSEVATKGSPAKRVNLERDGAPFFRKFVESLFDLRIEAARVLAKEFRIAAAKKPLSVLDVGAGSAVWSIAFAQSSNLVRVTAVDWERMLPVTMRVIQREGVADQYHLVPGDLARVDFGRSHDVALLGHILHSEGEARSRSLLHKMHAALAPGGRIAIAEFLLDDDRKGPYSSLAFAVYMLLCTEDGIAFTHRQISAWLEDAGFTGIRRLLAPAPSPLIVARRS